MYGKATIIPIKFEYKKLRIVVKVDMNLTTTPKERLDQLNALDEIRMESMHHTEVVQKQ